MQKRNNKEAGDSGEQEIIRLVLCPNCDKKLMKLPANFPLFDIQCTSCSFRAQVKTNNCKPKSVVFGAGWQIMDKVLKSGFLMPPLFLNFKWREKKLNNQEIRFYPFIPRKNLRKYKLSEKARRANYWMFQYKNMNNLPHFICYHNFSKRNN